MRLSMATNDIDTNNIDTQVVTPKDTKRNCALTMVFCMWLSCFRSYHL